MTEGTTCYERDETLCEDQMCLRTGCKLRNDRLAPSFTDTEAALLEDNIATLAFHLGQPGARLSVQHWKSGLIVEPGEVLKEVSRRLTAAQQPVPRGELPNEEADGKAAVRLLDAWSEISDAENFAPYQGTMALLGKPNSAGWVWAREVRHERDFDREQARQRDLAIQCVTDAEQVFRDACDEAGCAYDNEALLQAIAGLKAAAAPQPLDPAYTAKEPSIEELGGWIEHSLVYGISSKDGRMSARNLLAQFEIRPRSASCPPEEITKAEMDAIEDAAIAGHPLSSTQSATTPGLGLNGKPQDATDPLEPIAGASVSSTHRSGEA